MLRNLMSSLILVTALHPSSSIAEPQLQWQKIADTDIKSLCPERNFNGYEYDFKYHCGSITGAWSGAAFSQQTGVMYIWGGGHNDYYGNEIYAFDGKAAEMMRLTDPAEPATKRGSPKSELAPYDGSQPNGRHTYDGLNFLDKHGVMWAFTGSLSSGSGGADRQTWLFDPSTKRWRVDHAVGRIPRKSYGLVSAYHDQTDTIYLHDLYSFYKYEYHPSGGRYTHLSDRQVGLDLNAEIDPLRERFLMLGRGKQFVVDISRRSTFEQRKIPLNDGAGLLKTTKAPGLAFHSKLGRFFAWAGGNQLYHQDPETFEWHALNTQGAPAKSSSNGTFGRFVYWQSENAFLLVNRTTEDVYILRLPEGFRLN